MLWIRILRLVSCPGVLTGCGSSRSGSSSTTTTAPTTATTTGGVAGADPRLAIATAANDLSEYCLSKLHGTATRIDARYAVDRIIAAYHASGEDPKLREALRLVGTSLANGPCYKEGAARVQAAVGAAASP